MQVYHLPNDSYDDDNHIYVLLDLAQWKDFFICYLKELVLEGAFEMEKYNLPLKIILDSGLVQAGDQIDF